MSPTVCGVAAESPAFSGCEIPVSLPEGRVNNFSASPQQRDNSASAPLLLSLLLTLSSQPAYPRALRKLVCCNTVGRSCWRTGLFSLLYGFGAFSGFCHLAQMLGLTQTAFSKLPNMAALVIDTICRNVCSCTTGEVLAGSCSTVQNMCALDGASAQVSFCQHLSWVGPFSTPCLPRLPLSLSLGPWQGCWLGAAKMRQAHPPARNRALLGIAVLQCSYDG